MGILDGLFGPPDIKKLAAKRDVHGLIKALRYKRDENGVSAVLYEAATALGELKGLAYEAAEPLLEALEAMKKDKGKYAYKIEAVIGALGEIGASGAVEPILEILANVSASFSNDSLKTTCVYALGKLKDGRSIAPITQVLNSKSASQGTAKTAVRALANIGPSSMEALTAALEHHDRMVQEEVAKVLFDFPDRRIIVPVANHLASTGRLK